MGFITKADVANGTVRKGGRPPRKDQGKHEKLFRQMAEDGMSMVEIARQTGFSRQYVHQVGLRYGIEFPNGRIIIDDYERVKEWHAKGWWTEEIARRSGVQPERAAMILRREGLPSRRTPKFAPRLLEVLDGLAAGKYPAQIAKETGMEPPSVLGIMKHFNLKASVDGRALRSRNGGD